MSVKLKFQSRGQRVLRNIVSIMFHSCCCEPRCLNRSDRENYLWFFILLLKNKALMKAWIHHIGWKTCFSNHNACDCSKHFEGATQRCLLSDDCPSLRLPVLATLVKKMQRKLAKECDVKSYKQKLEKQKFRVYNMVEDDGKVAFYTELQYFGTLQAIHKYTHLGPAVNDLFYPSKHAENAKPMNHWCRRQTLLPLEKLFMTLVHLWLGLTEQDTYISHWYISTHCL